MYRFLSDCADPLTVLLLAAALLLVRLWRRPEAARRTVRWLFVGVALLAVLYLPATAYLMLGTLEWAYPPRPDRPEGVEAIVVMGGYVKPPAAPGMAPELGSDSLLRCVRATELYKGGPPCPVVVTGGLVHPPGKAPPVARAMRDFLAAHGVDPRDLVVEDVSGSTHENAVETAKVLRGKGIKRVALVTDAAHLRRSLACFRAEGVDAVPCGCRYAAVGGLGVLDFLLPDPATDVKRRTAAHEWVGLAWYKMRRYC
jgi:uncharacterized SAM-binding protein YcdF (DUF218 family)